MGLPYQESWVCAQSANLADWDWFGNGVSRHSICRQAHPSTSDRGLGGGRLRANDFGDGSFRAYSMDIMDYGTDLFLWTGDLQTSPNSILPDRPCDYLVRFFVAFPTHLWRFSTLPKLRG